MKTNRFEFLALIACLMATTAWAETTPGTSVITRPNILNNIKLSYAGFYRGPSVTNISSFQPDNPTGVESGKLQVIESTLLLGYKINDVMTAGAAYNFNLYPLREKDWKVANPYLKLSHTKLFDDGKGLNLSSDLRVYAPVTKSAKDSGLVTAVRLTPNIGWDIPNTRWALAMDGVIRAKFYNNPNAGGSADADAFYLYLDPNVSYKITPKLAGVFGFEKDVIVKLVNMPYDTSAIGDTYFAASWDVTPQVNLYPVLSFYPTNMRLNATQFYMAISAKLL